MMNIDELTQEHYSIAEVAKLLKLDILTVKCDRKRRHLKTSGTQLREYSQFGHRRKLKVLVASKKQVMEYYQYLITKRRSYKRDW
jgi:hypothetical protein